jgi:hypothetical protein
MNPTQATNNITQAPDKDGKHSHKCDKCGVDYVHYHPHKTGVEHAQFTFQCPNPDCEWFYEKGKATKPGQVPRSTGDEAKPAETYKQRSVRIAYQEGTIKCGKVSHFDMKSNGGQYKVPVRTKAIDIINQMSIGADSKCECERTACIEAWAWNRPGTFENDWVQPGSYHRGWGKYEPSNAPRRVMPLTFNLSKQQVEYLHTRNPGWLFVTVGTDFHDHPVAHAQSQVATYNLFHSLRAGKYLDLHGNPAHCERLNAEMKDKTFTAMCNVESTADVVRKNTKWGEKVKGGKVRWVESALRDISTCPGERPEAAGDARDAWDERKLNMDTLQASDGLTSVHTLYYYEPCELAHVINSTKGKMMTAIMHRFVGQSGTINNGEQRWERYEDKNGKSRIRQTNVLTNMSYDHVDNERWFQNYSWSPYRGTDAGEHLNEKIALAWDANIAADGVFVFRITTATVREALLDTSWKEPAPVEIKLNSAAYVKKYGKVKLENLSGTEEITIPDAYQDLFNELRLRCVSYTSHDTAKYKSHAQYVAVKTKGTMAVKNVDDVQVIYDLCYASFWVDRKLDRSFAASYNTDAKRLVIDAIILAATSKSLLSGLAEACRGIRHRL